MFFRPSWRLRCDPSGVPTRVTCRAAPATGAGKFMLLPDQHPADFEHPDRVWSLLEPWYRPDDGPLTRSAVYEFRSTLADQMRSGHVLLVGDAAHLTPPFLGQGLCSGLRDAANVAWKLDLVLRGLAPERLLDTVDTERQPDRPGGDPTGHRARKGALPAGPAGRRRARCDARTGRAAATTGSSRR